MMSGDMKGAERGTTLRGARVPLAVYGATYALTFFVGAVALLTSPVIVALQQVVAGAEPYWLSSEQVFANVLLVVACPLLVALGYELVLRLPEDEGTPDAFTESSRAGVVTAAVWAMSCAAALASLARAGAFGRLGAWANYRAWVFARWQLFDVLTTWEFVNIYVFVPVLTSLVVVRLLRPPRRVVAASLATALMVAIDLLVFQKKTLIVSTLLVGLTIAFRLSFFERAGARRLLKALAGLAAFGYFLYVLTILRPTIGKQAQAMVDAASSARRPAVEVPESGSSRAERTAANGDPASPTASMPDALTAAAGVGPTGRPVTESRRSRALRSFVARVLPGRWIGQPPGRPLPHLARGEFLTLYVLLGPTLRTPLPALVYPAVYPARSPFFGIDVGLDILGIGRMPFDNIQIHRLLWPGIEGGTVMVPFQFSSFSQAGLGWALLSSVLAGGALAAAWKSARRASAPDASASASALVVLLAIYLAGDSLRNSLLASYGVVWGILVLIAWRALVVAKREESP